MISTKYYCPAHNRHFSDPELCQKRKEHKGTPEAAMGNWHCKDCEGPVMSIEAMEGTLDRLEARRG